MTLAVVELGVGNTASMIFALERLGARPVLTSDVAAIAEAERVILPGVGAAGFAMQRIEALGLAEVLKRFPRPLLGVCLGQQLLFESSEEGAARLLGRIPSEVRRLAPAPDRPVPHMGWNRLRRERDDPLLDGVADGAFVYFVHSFASPVGAWTLATSDYGGPFSAVVREGTAWGCQFHPERSSEAGAKILRNFLDLPC
jgi:imidazole glycerol-phosphate synthase subunit HisH